MFVIAGGRARRNESKDFLLPEDVVTMWDSDYINRDVKKSRSDCKWKDVHEQVFAMCEYKWPPPETQQLMESGFKQREAELVYFCNRRFPLKDELVWEFFDSHHSFERVFNWGPASGDVKLLRTPWKRYVPTMVGTSSIACRCLQNGTVVFKELHGLEAMRMIGWDLGHWKNHENPFGNSAITPELLVDMAGNAWSSFQFLPIAIAAFGAAPKSFYRGKDVGVSVPAPQAIDVQGESSGSESDDVFSD